MTTTGPSRVRLRLVIDPGVFVSGAISNGAPRQLLEAAVAGRITVIISPLLLAELDEVLHRPKFRRWFTLQRAEDLLHALQLLGELVPDPPSLPAELRQQICRDPGDDYLVALAEANDATFLVSGDRDLTELSYGPVTVRTPHAALAAVDQQHPWGAAFASGSDEEARRRAQVEGHDGVLACAGTFIVMLTTGDSEIALADLVTPESAATWMTTLDQARGRLAGRDALTSRPEYPSPDIAYVRVVPDPGEPIMATAEVLVDNSIILTMQRRPELLDINGFGGWRVHHLGDRFPIEQMPPR